MLKRCTKCAELKPRDQFHLRQASHDGLQFRCKACVSVADRERRAKYPERGRAQYERWCEANREKYLAYKKEYRAKNSEKIKAEIIKWRTANAEHVRKYKQERKVEAWNQERKRRARRGPKVLIALAKKTITQTTGIPFREIPPSMAEAKAAQLAVLRETRNAGRK